MVMKYLQNYRKLIIAAIKLLLILCSAFFVMYNTRVFVSLSPQRASQSVYIKIFDFKIADVSGRILSSFLTHKIDLNAPNVSDEEVVVAEVNLFNKDFTPRKNRLLFLNYYFLSVIFEVSSPEESFEVYMEYNNIVNKNASFVEVYEGRQFLLSKLADINDDKTERGPQNTDFNPNH